MHLEDVQLLHFIPGRVRFRIAGLKGDWGQAETIQKGLEAVPDIDSVEVNVTTGSVVARYDPNRISALNFQMALTEACGISDQELTPDRLAAWYAGQTQVATN